MANQCYSLVTAQFYLASKGKHILEVWGPADPKEERSSILAPLFICFFSSPLSLLYVNWDSQEGCFNWGSHSSPRTFLCSIFVGFSFACQIKLSCNQAGALDLHLIWVATELWHWSTTSNFCCSKTEPRKLHTPPTNPIFDKNWKIEQYKDLMTL